MNTPKLIISLPYDMCTATSLGVDGLAGHNSPGSGQVFHSRAIFVDLKLDKGKPGFTFRDEGGWRDAKADTETALAECETKRTKTALSNSAFNVVPMDAFESVSLVKTGGHVLTLESAGELFRFRNHAWRLNMSPDDLAEAAGLPRQPSRQPRCYMVFAPVELVILSNLTPEEYAWYATHRAGKLFRQVMFTEIKPNLRDLAAEQTVDEARDALSRSPSKKTKTVFHGSAIDKVPFTAWIGFGANDQGGLYCADRDHLRLWRFPAKIPSSWAKADG